MNDEPLVRDPELAALLRDQHPPEPLDEQRRAVLHARIRRVAAAELAAAAAHPAAPTAASHPAPRAWRQPRLVLPLAAAAALALFVTLPAVRPPADGSRSGNPLLPAGTSVAAIDDIMDADITEAQFRAVLAGAADIDELLLLVAADGE